MERDQGSGSEPLMEGGEELPRGILDLPRPPEGLREAVLLRTTAILRSRRRRRWAIRLTSFLAVYCAGLGTALIPRGGVVEQPEAASPGLPGRAAAGADLDPREILARVPLAPAAERHRLLRQAGDAYLAGGGDVQGALHCYRQLLEISGRDQESSPNPEDTWLLLALKQGKHDEERR